MQGRAAAVYALVFLLAAAASFAYVATAETPEPTMQDPEYTVQQGDSFSITGPDGNERSYTVSEFDEQRGQPAAFLVWTDDDARSTEEWEHAEDPGGTTIVYRGSDYYVRIPQVADPGNFTLLEAPAEDSDVSLLTDDEGNWIVNDGGDYVALEEYEGLDRVTVETGATFQEGTGENAREVRVEEITNESVTVSWNQPSETEVIVRQTDRNELNGVNVTSHFPDDSTLQLTTDEDEIDRYLQAHEDRVHFQQRVDGLIATTVLSLVALALLIGLAFLPRKE